MSEEGMVIDLVEPSGLRTEFISLRMTDELARDIARDFNRMAQQLRYAVAHRDLGGAIDIPISLADEIAQKIRFVAHRIEQERGEI